MKSSLRSGRLASSIAHEINNPLEAVTNLLYLAKHSEVPAETRAYLAHAEIELRRVAAITNQTLRFHRQATSASEVTFAQLTEELLRGFDGRLINSGIEVRERNTALGPVTCFEGEIRQVLVNLVGNAIDAMHGKGGVLHIRGRDGTEWRTGRRGLLITIADSGEGMPERVKDKIFEAFFTTKGMSGTGLGLWISRDILLRHEGSLAFRSSQKQHASGTVFRLFLPG